MLILKIIGIILLSLVVLILLVTAAVLFVPVRYEALISNETKEIEDTNVRLRISWLLRIFRFLLEYVDFKLSMKIKILFFTFWDSLKEETEETSEEIKDTEEEKTEEKTEETEEKTEEETEEKEEAEEKTEEKTEEKEEEKTEEKTEEKQEEKKKKKKDKKEEAEEKEPGIADKLKSGIELIKKPESKAALHLVKEEALYLLKHYMIRSIKGELIYSAGKPDLTGKILGALCCFPFMYHKGFVFRADFTCFEPYIMGNVRLKGHIRLIHLVKSALKLYFSKDFMNFYKEASEWL